MAVVDFDEFSRGFRERTAQRMLDFEKTLAKAQLDIERAAQEAREKLTREGAGGIGKHPMAAHPEPRGYGSVHGGDGKAPRHGGGTGQVRSVLRREP